MHIHITVIHLKIFSFIMNISFTKLNILGNVNSILRNCSSTSSFPFFLLVVILNDYPKGWINPKFCKENKKKKRRRSRNGPCYFSHSTNRESLFPQTFFFQVLGKHSIYFMFSRNFSSKFCTRFSKLTPESINQTQ